MRQVRVAMLPSTAPAYPLGARVLHTPASRSGRPGAKAGLSGVFRAEEVLLHRLVQPLDGAHQASDRLLILGTVEGCGVPPAEERQARHIRVLIGRHA